jgi:hypothetical protein
VTLLVAGPLTVMRPISRGCQAAPVGRLVVGSKPGEFAIAEGEGSPGRVAPAAKVPYGPRACLLLIFPRTNSAP